MFLLRGNKDRGLPSGQLMKQGEISASVSCPWPPGPQLPQRACYMVAVGTLLPADTPRHCPPPLGTTIPSLGGQEGVNSIRKGLLGRKQAVPTRLRCQGDRPALMGPSHYYSVQV